MRDNGNVWSAPLLPPMGGSPLFFGLIPFRGGRSPPCGTMATFDPLLFFPPWEDDGALPWARLIPFRGGRSPPCGTMATFDPLCCCCCYDNLNLFCVSLQICPQIFFVCLLQKFFLLLYLPVEEWGGVVVHDVKNFFYFLSIWVPSCSDSQYHPQTVSLVCQRNMVDTQSILFVRVSLTKYVYTI